MSRALAWLYVLGGGVVGPVVALVLEAFWDYWTSLL